MSDTNAESAAPNWYPDPEDATQLRYWDGRQWTEHRAPRAGIAPAVGTRRTAALGRASLWLAVALTCAQVGVAAFGSTGERNLIRDVETGSLTFGWYDAFGMLWIVLVIPTYIVTCLWLARCRSNVEALRPSARQARGRVWVWLGWVVPVVAAWFPFQVVRDIGTYPAEVRDSTRRPPALGWWWAVWLVANATTNVAAGVGVSGDRPLLSIVAEMERVSAVGFLVCLIFWVRIIAYIQRDQAQLASNAGIIA